MCLTDCFRLREFAASRSLRESGGGIHATFQASVPVNVDKEIGKTEKLVSASQVEEHADGRVEEEGLVLVQDVLRAQKLHLVHHRDAAHGEQTLQG